MPKLSKSYECICGHVAAELFVHFSFHIVIQSYLRHLPNWSDAPIATTRWNHMRHQVWTCPIVLHALVERCSPIPIDYSPTHDPRRFLKIGDVWLCLTLVLVWLGCSQKSEIFQGYHLVYEKLIHLESRAWYNRSSILKWNPIGNGCVCPLPSS